MMKTRISPAAEPEIMDLGPEYYSVAEYEDCLIKLDRIGRWLGGDYATFSILDRLNFSSVLDVGCGGGLFTARLAKRYPQAKFIGIDLNPLAIEFANHQKALSKTKLPNLSFMCPEQKELNELIKYDVVLSTLVCHHMLDKELIDFLAKASRIAQKKVILNDLHRHPLAFFLFKMIGPILFKNRLVQHDGPLSVRRGFKNQEWINYLEKAGIHPSCYKIKWKFAFRWLVEINKSECND